MKRHLIKAALAGVVLFAWGFLSWAVLPWHNAVANKFVDEIAVESVLQIAAPKNGVYYLPFNPDDHKPGRAAAFVNVLPQGFRRGMGAMMAMAVVGQFLSALLVLYLLKQAALSTYGKRVRFAAVTGGAIGFISHFPYWNWFGFSTAYVAVIVLDSVIAWTLAGLVLARKE